MKADQWGKNDQRIGHSGMENEWVKYYGIYTFRLSGILEYLEFGRSKSNANDS